MSSTESISQVRLKEVLDYNPETGEFTWRVRLSNVIQIGDVAGCELNGYIVIRVDRRLYKASRLAWFYIYGYWPIEIDHKNRITADDSINNLREATSQQNKGNRSVRFDSRTQVKGVYKHYNKYVATIRINGKSIYLGLFWTIEEASEAYNKAAKEHFGEFSG